MHKIKHTRVIRRVVQLGFAAFILVAAVRHSLGAEHLPSTDAFCPFGAVETLWQFASTGTFVSKTHPSNLVVGIGLLLGALIAGPSFCGWICPFGALNDLLTWIRKKLHLPEIRVPDRLDRVLVLGRYVTLAGILYATIATATLWFADYDPYRTIFSLSWLFEFDWLEHWPAYVIALGVIAGGLLIPRFWCRYLCPQSAILSLLQRISPVKVWRNAATCISCKRCDRACPTHLNVSTAEAVKGNCIGCLECVDVCPVGDTLTVNLGRPQAARPKAGRPKAEVKEGV
jgi:polyferredoxin